MDPPSGSASGAKGGGGAVRLDVEAMKNLAIDNPDHASEEPSDEVDDLSALREANRRLRAQLDAGQRVDITGPRGRPVYASGSFREGRWLDENGGVKLFVVDIATTGEESTKLPLSTLEDIEIRLGGVLYASASSHSISAYMDETDWDGDARKEVLCRFGGPVTGVLLPLRIEGWARKHWEAVQRKEFARRKNEFREDLDVHSLLVEEVIDCYPEASVSFYQASFFGHCVEQTANNLGLSMPQMDAKIEGQQGDLFWNIANTIVSNLRAAGCSDVGVALTKRVNELQTAAYMMVSMKKESREAVEAEVPVLVELQMVSTSAADFLSTVQRRYGLSRPTLRDSCDRDLMASF